MVIPSQTMLAIGQRLMQKTVEANDKLQLMLDSQGVQGSDVAALSSTKAYLSVEGFKETFLQLQEYQLVL